MKEKILVPIGIAVAFAIMLLIAFTHNGTGDSGDSVMHFLVARDAFMHPENFFSVWGKPLYVFLGAPFAQFGFIGIKIFNIINTLISAVCTYLVAKKMNFNNSWMVIVFLLIFPMNIIMAFSGLTEPLFATILISGICLLFYNKTATGLILLSFMPFVRSEGLFIIVIVAGWLILQKKYKNCLWLLTGQVVYAFIGYIVSTGFLWFYTGNPYSLKNPLGHGAWSDFFDFLSLILSYPLMYFFTVGVLLIPVSLLVKKIKNNFIQPNWQLLLIWTLFITYFAFHAAVWALGLFGGGMARIVIGVAPLMAIICLFSFNSLAGILGKWFNPQVISGLLLAAVIITDIYYIDFHKDTYTLTTGFSVDISIDELAENNAVAYLKKKFPYYKSHTISYGAPYIGIALDEDYYEPNHMVCLNGEKVMPDSSFIIWEKTYSGRLCGVPIKDIEKDTTMVLDTTFVEGGKWGSDSILLYRKKNAFPVK